MTCNEVRQHWMLYVDSEGDAELHFRISDHLGMCSACAEWFAGQQRFEQALASYDKALALDPHLDGLDHEVSQLARDVEGEKI